MIYYNKQFIDQDDITSVKKILKSKFLTQGNTIKAFENKLSLKFKSKYCSVLSNGTAALHLAIKSLNLKKNSKILTTPITFISTVSSIMMNDLVPTFADIDKETFTLDPNQVEDILKKDKKVKAIIGVDYAGNPCDWKALNYLKKKYNLKLINDNCHAMGSKLDNDMGYAIKYSDIVTHSYHAIKNFTTGEGGSVLTNNKKIFELINNYRSHNMIKTSKDYKKFGRWFYKVDTIGYNYRLTDIQSALGISQLNKLNKFIKKRRKVAKVYDNLLNGISFVQRQKIQKNVHHSFHLYPILINFKKIKKDKKKLFNFMAKNNIFLQVNYQPLHYQPFVKKRAKFKKGDFPVAENFYEKQISLPVFYKITKIQQINLIRKLLSFIKN